MLENPAVKEQERDEARRERRDMRCKRAESFLADEFHDAMTAGAGAPLSVHRIDVLGLPVFDHAPLLSVVQELIEGEQGAAVVALLLDCLRGQYLHDDPVAVSVAENIAQIYAAREVERLNASGAFNDGADYDDAH